MRKLRLEPTLSIEVSPLSLPSLGLPRGPEPCTHLAVLLQGSWSKDHGATAWARLEGISVSSGPTSLLSVIPEHMAQFHADGS